MIVLGLTGSIGMGKSTAASILRRMGLPLHDADEAVHRLLGKGGAAVAEVEATFPGVVVDGAVDRQRLGARVFRNRAALKRLESILHPAVRHEARAFLRREIRRGNWLVVVDIPMLFETGGQELCDAVIVVTAPRFVQETRVLGRPGMTRERFRAIQARQMPDREKRWRADFLVNTGLSKRDTLRQLNAIVTLLRRRAGRSGQVGGWSRPRPCRHPKRRRYHA